nr:hypothetical protein [Fluoribacter dumoffii]
MCTIEKFYMDMLRADAESLAVPVVEVLRRAIKNYHNEVSGKNL